VAEVCKRSETTVRRWTYDKARGTGGLVPAAHQIDLLRAAPVRGWPLRPDDFIPQDVLDALGLQMDRAA
jgi:hypothetical protein